MLLIIIALVVGILVVAWGLLMAWMYRYATEVRGCPRCHQPVVRAHRSPFEKSLERVLPGVRRYHCKNCRWDGLLIHKSRNQ